MSLFFRYLRGLLPLSLLFGSVANAQVKSPAAPISVEKLLVPWKDKIEKSRRDAVIVDLSQGEENLLSSKIGGRPYLPVGQSLPRNSRNEEMYLLAQINFAEVPELPDFPRKGILQFFISSDDHYGANFEGDLSEANLSRQKDFRVLYHENVNAESATITYPPSNKQTIQLPFDPNKILRMKFRLVHEIVSPGDFEFEKFLGMDFLSLLKKLQKVTSLDESELEQALEDFFGEQGFEHKIGGYASFTQDDPRRSDSRKRLLLQINSDTNPEVGLMWGDLGIAGFFIDPVDLKNKNFSQIMYNWDCG